MNLNLLRENFKSSDFERKMLTRLERLQKAEMNPVERVNLMMDCQEDPFYFIDTFGVVYEPRLAEMSDIPFFLFDYQKDVIMRVLQAEERGEDLLIEKTRDMGITWTMIWYILWRWLFKDKWYCLMGSRKEDEVDNKSPNSLFGKLRYAFYTLPTWMRPVKFRKSENDTFMKFMNPDKMSYVDGESANPNFARGKRVSLCFMDEIFFWKFARESWRAATDTSPVRIAVSTPKASSFARTLRDSFEEQGKLITLDWKKHPFKDETWYKKELERRSSDPLSIAAELEISYVSDPTLAYYPEVFMCPVRELKYNPKLPLYIGTDFGARDKTAIVYFQRDSIYHYCIEGIEKSNKPLYWFVPFLKRGYHFNNAESYELVNKFTKETYLIKERDYNDEELTLIKKFNTWNNPVMYCGETADLQTKQRAMVNSSTDIDLRAVGIFLRINRSAAEHKPRRLSTKKMLSKTIFAKDGGALDVYDALANSTYSRTRENSSVEKDSPVHDEYADMRSAVENYAVNVIMENEKVREFKYKYR